jgi:3-mercaptopyruvate sulfurtransferase SseA
MMGSQSNAINAHNQNWQNYQNAMLNSATQNANMANQAGAANASGTNAMVGSGIGAAATAAAAVCWVARAAFGTRSSRWMQFRSAMFASAPDSFIAAYCRFGERASKVVGSCFVTRAIGRIALRTMERVWAW